MWPRRADQRDLCHNGLMDAAYEDLEAVRQSLSASCSRLVRAETAFRHAESWNRMAHKRYVGALLSTASAGRRLDRSFSHLAAAVTDFQHSYHRLDLWFSSRALDLEDYDWNDRLLYTVLQFLKDYLTVDSEASLKSLMDRRAIEGA